MYQRSYNGRVKLAPGASIYPWILAAAIRDQIPDLEQSFTIRTPVGVRIELSHHNRAQCPDIDNIRKVLYDALSNVLHFDDAWIDEEHANKFIDTGLQPGIVVAIYSLATDI